MVPIETVLANQIAVSSCFCAGMNWTQFWFQVWGRLREWRLPQGQWWPHPPIRYLSSSSPFFYSLLSSCIKIPMAFLLASTSKFGGHYLVCIIVFKISTCDHLSSRAYSAVVCLVLMFLLLEREVRAPQWAFLFGGLFWGLYIQRIFSYERETH